MDVERLSRGECPRCGGKLVRDREIYCSNCKVALYPKEKKEIKKYKLAIPKPDGYCINDNIIKMFTEAEIKEIHKEYFRLLTHGCRNPAQTLADKLGCDRSTISQTLPKCELELVPEPKDLPNTRKIRNVIQKPTS